MGFPSAITREAGTSPSTRRRPGRRLSGSHLFIGLVAVLAFAFNYLALQDRGATILVAVASRALPAGSQLGPDDFRLVPVPSDFEGVGSLLTQAELVNREGWLLDRAVGTDGVIDKSMLSEPGAPSGLRAMSIPVPVEHAAGGGIGVGDRVDVISTAGGAAAYVVSDVSVLSVANPDSAPLGAIGAYHIVVAVDAEQALLLAEAISNGSLEVLRSTGAPPIDEAGSG